MPSAWNGGQRKSQPRTHFTQVCKTYSRAFGKTPAFSRRVRCCVCLVASLIGLWHADAESPLLIHPHHLDFNDTETQNVLDRINASLLNARSRDVARGGGSTAEALATQPGLEAAPDAAKTIFLSSLAIAPNAIIGLIAEEVSAYLCSPGRDVSRYGAGLLTSLEDDSWYLHRRTDGRWVYRDVKNVTSAIRDRAQIAMAGDGPKKEAQSRLREIFKAGAARDRGQGDGRASHIRSCWSSQRSKTSRTRWTPKRYCSQSPNLTRRA